VFFKGRADDMINNAGVKFYSIEVETALLSHPDITEAAVIGWPFPPHGETAVAFLVANRALAERDLHRFCTEQIAAYKVPKNFLTVSELPKTQWERFRRAGSRNSTGRGCQNPRLNAIGQN
jgi:acyl-coenzyme A synthetase/AMP-(fatty) acid ligase